jgi:hypothetical protein
MSTTTHWDDLNRSQQRLMIRLYGGGTVRKQDPEAIAHLHGCVFVGDAGVLTTLGRRSSWVPFAGSKRISDCARRALRKHLPRVVAC